MPEIHWRAVIVQCGHCGDYAPREIEVQGQLPAEPVHRFYCPACGCPDPIIAFCTPMRVPTAEQIARDDAAAERRKKEAEERLRERLGARKQKPTRQLETLP